MCHNKPPASVSVGRTYGAGSIISSYMQYSEEIVDRYKTYMKADYGREVSDEQAQIEIRRLTSLFTTLAEIDQRNGSGDRISK
jgi:hypothetical protein